MFNIYTKMATALGAFALLFSTGAWGQCDPGTFQWTIQSEADRTSRDFWQLNAADGTNLLSGDGAELEKLLAKFVWQKARTLSLAPTLTVTVGTATLPTSRYGNLIGSYVMDV